MHLIKKLFYETKLRSKNKGIAALQLAFCLPVIVVLLYMVIDIYQLFRIKGQIHSLGLSVTQNTLAVIDRHKRATSADLKEIAETAIMAFQGNLSKQDYNLHIAWEMIKRDASSTAVMWSAYCKKAGKEDVQVRVGETPTDSVDYATSDVWSAELTKIETSNIKSTGAILASSPGKIHVNLGTYALVITVIFSQSKTNGWYNISDIVYNAMKNTFGGCFASQSFVILQDESTFPAIQAANT